MDSRKVLILAAVTGLLLIAALWFGAQRQPDSGESERGALLPDFAQQVNDVSALRLSAAGGERLWQIERQGERWTVPARSGYAADFGRVRELLLKLAAAQKVEPKTASPALYGRLGVQDVTEADAEGLLLEIEGGQAPIALIVGRATPKSDGNFVRLADQAQSWQVDVALPIERDPAQWLQRAISKLPVSRVRRVEIVHGDGDRVELVRNAEAGTDFTVGNVPRGREIGSNYLADSAASLFADLSLDDVASAQERPLPEDDKQVTRARYELDDGLLYRIDAWEADGKTLAQIAVELDEARAGEAIAAAQALLREEFEARQAAADRTESNAAEAGADDSEADGEAAAEAGEEELAPAPPAAVSDPEADALQRLQALKTEAEQTQARLAGWTFTLPSHKASSLNRKLTGYLAPKE